MKTNRKRNGVKRISYSRKQIRRLGRTARAGSRRKLRFPTKATVGCVICVMNERQTLQRQLDELKKLPFEEVIVVVNGSSDGSDEIARQHPIQANVIQFAEALGHDVGRAIGAAVSRSDIMLFLDGDMCVPAKSLLPFVKQAAKGADVVLNPISTLLPVFGFRDPVSHLKHFLNVSLGNSGLVADSLTSVPHVLSRNAIQTIGPEVLCIPPLAQAKAIQSGLRVVSAPRAFNVIKYNRKRKDNVGRGNRVEQLIIGDHLEAFHALMANSPRLDFEDTMRRRWEIDLFQTDTEAATPETEPEQDHQNAPQLA